MVDQVPTLADLYQAKRDVKDINTFTHSPETTFVDGDGLTKLTLTGVLAQIRFDFKDPLTFTTGATLNSNIECLRRESDGEYFRWAGPVPKVVAPGTNPLSDPLYVAVGSAALASQLNAGTALIAGVPASDLQKKSELIDGEAIIAGVKSKHVSVSKNSIVNVMDYDSVESAVAASAGKTLFFGDYQFNISEEIILPITTSVIMSPSATIKATAEIESVFKTDNGNAERRQYILTNIDCNGLAHTPLHLRNGNNCKVSASNVYAPKLYGLRLGNSAGGQSYGHHIIDYRANRQVGVTSGNNLALPIANAGSVGLLEENTTDIKGVLLEMVGFQKGHIGGGTGFYTGFHAWASQKQNLMDYGFIPAGSSKYVTCHADQPQIGGWLVENAKWRVGLYGCVHFNSPNGDTDVSTSVSVILGSAVGAFTCYGLEIKGNRKGVAKDFEITSSQLNDPAFVIEGTTYENVVTKNALYKRKYRSVSFDAVNETGTRALQIGSSASGGYIQDDKAGGLMYRGSTSGFEFNVGAKPMSWNGNAPIPKPTIVGSRGSNTALQNLLQALASYGLITNDTDS